MNVKPCPRCFGSQKEHGPHETWQDCSDEMNREDLRSPARRVRSANGHDGRTSERRNWETVA